MNLYKIVESKGGATFFRSMVEATKASKHLAPCWIHSLDETDVSGKQLIVDLLNDSCSWTMVKAVKGKAKTTEVVDETQVPAFTRQAPDGSWSHNSFATKADIVAGNAQEITW